MKRRIGMQYFLPLGVYALIASILTGVFLIFLQDDFTHFVMGLVALGSLLLSVFLSLMGMILLDFLKKASRAGYLFQAVAFLLIGATGILYFFFRFEERTSWNNVFFFLALIGAALGLIYSGRSFFSFLSYRAQQEFAKQFGFEEPEEPTQKDSPSFDPEKVIEVDAVDVEEKGEKD